MTNPNLIRPSKLESSQSPGNQSQAVQAPASIPNLGGIIRRIINETFLENNLDRILLSATDETIRPEHRGQ